MRQRRGAGRRRCSGMARLATGGLSILTEAGALDRLETFPVMPRSPQAGGAGEKGLTGCGEATRGLSRDADDAMPLAHRAALAEALHAPWSRGRSEFAMMTFRRLPS